jgi:hypothetical protein
MKLWLAVISSAVVVLAIGIFIGRSSVRATITVQDTKPFYSGVGVGRSSAAVFQFNDTINHHNRELHFSTKDDQGHEDLVLYVVDGKAVMHEDYRGMRTFAAGWNAAKYEADAKEVIDHTLFRSPWDVKKGSR